MKKILIIDDDPNIRFFLSEFLESQGFSCDTAENGKRALGELNRQRFDLVITDLNMPLMDGLEFISKLKKNADGSSSIPVIMLTGDVNPTFGYNGLQAGAVGILNKPFDKNELLAMISDALYQNTAVSCGALA